MTPPSPASLSPKLPTEPYPGLRPFLDHEAPLLMGRTSQVDDIVDRLRETQFVAVVGGSGCGKSSLIRAGVVPRLRSFGIPTQGDYWIPVVYTPGTARSHEQPSSEQPPGDESPVTRLAWRLSRLLESSASATSEGDASRRREIADVFRQGAGFARLVEGYSKELRAVGPSGADARFVFVIDQFEELFHPNNHDNPDAIATIEAVISHFYNPHKRCFVVLTMRSEHLADCAGYLELPDAINKSLYLVRRLNEQEIREAIVGPAKYYLRLRQRAYDPSVQLPPDVMFDEKVIGRLMRDADTIKNDADHLPLLQHLLARMWYSACQREDTPEGGVPAEVRWEDLDRAVALKTSQSVERDLKHDHLNTLRASLQNWAQSTYLDRTEVERLQVDEVLRKLAFRDPTSGLYFQQRIEVDTLGAAGDSKEQLRKLLEHGFLDTVNYLFWDDENPEHVTLKVSHEAFIRGWEHFRKLIDREAERFEEFVSLLRRCKQWKVEGSSKFLLQSSELTRVETAKLDEVFKFEDQRRRWFQHLLEYRYGEELADAEPQLDQFLRESRQQLEREERVKADALRNRVLFHRALFLVGALLVVLAFIWRVHLPVYNSVLQLQDARNLASAPRVLTPDADDRQLRVLLESVRLVRETKDWSVTALVERLSFIWPFTTYKVLLEKPSAEQSVSGPLRDLLTTTVWPSAAPDKAASASVAKLQGRYECQSTAVTNASGDGDNGPVTGTLLESSSQTPRAIFVREAGGTLYFHPAVNRTNCIVGPPFYTIDTRMEPAVVADATLDYVAVVQKAPGSEQEDISVFALQWGLDPARPDVRLRPFPRRGDTNGDVAAANYVREEVARGGVNGLKPVRTWPARAGSVVAVGEENGEPRYWRLFANTAAVITQPYSADLWTKLRSSSPQAACAEVLKVPSPAGQAPVLNYLFENESTCFEIRGYPDGPPSSENLIWVMTVYTPFQAPTLRRNDRPVGTSPLAEFSLGVFPKSQNQAPTLLIGVTGSQWDGWVAVEQPGKSLMGAPWATFALANLGCDVLAADQVGVSVPTDLAGFTKAKLCSAKSGR